MQIDLDGRMPGSIAHATMDLPTVRATIHVDFDSSKMQFAMRLTLPADVSAEVDLPRLNAVDAMVIVDGTAQQSQVINDQLAIFGIGSGKHIFQRVARRVFHLPSNSVIYFFHTASDLAACGIFDAAVHGIAELNVGLPAKLASSFYRLAQIYSLKFPRFCIARFPRLVIIAPGRLGSIVNCQ